MDERERQMVILSMENEVFKSTTVQAYNRGGEEGISFGQSSGAALYKNSQEFTEEMCRHGSSFYVDGFDADGLVVYLGRACSVSARFIIHGFTTTQFIIHGYTPALFIIHGFATTPFGGPSVGPSSSSHWFGSIAPTS
ncbi:hypothetical protein Salat_1120400 [Sesamum alatum]|uniref:Uncharacterized protein n=1 Tax=Sesamum alatum TaxID=300844 RepID=A0AAE2CT59_9LAMI|nr:hypothetical protein Salat_1120400 [Sesamum alatum]